jgi:hypothetical protein
LKKRAGLVPLVTDLQTDLASGLCLAHLIEIISGTSSLTAECSTSDYRHNIDCILRFMHANAIKMHQTTAKEIVEGNLKSIMRLVLALAAHFKPSNVQPYKVVADAQSQRHQQQQNQRTSASAVTTAGQQQHHASNHHMVYPVAPAPPNVGKRSSSTNNVHTNGTYVLSGGEANNGAADQHDPRYNNQSKLNFTKNIC